MGLGLVALSYDPPAVVKVFAESKKIEFLLLSDHDHRIVRRYGLLNRAYEPWEPGYPGLREPGDANYGIPHPGTFILDRDGRVVERFFEPEYQFRHTAASVARKIGRPVAAMGPPSQQTTRHLRLRTFVSDERVAPGHRFSIVLDVTPRSGIHVYAPGKHTYRVITLKLESNPLVRTYPVSYPESVEYHFVPLDERVQVYDARFELVQDAAVVVTHETRGLAEQPGATVTLSGVLEYQACTDTICYPPAEMPLEWTVGLKPLQ